MIQTTAIDGVRRKFSSNALLASPMINECKIEFQSFAQCIHSPSHEEVLIMNLEHSSKNEFPVVAKLLTSENSCLVCNVPIRWLFVVLQSSDCWVFRVQLS